MVLKAISDQAILAIGDHLYHRLGLFLRNRGGSWLLHQLQRIEGDRAHRMDYGASLTHCGKGGGGDHADLHGSVWQQPLVTRDLHQIMATGQQIPQKLIPRVWRNPLGRAAVSGQHNGVLGQINQNHIDFGIGQPMQLAQMGSKQHGPVFSQQSLRQHVRKSRSQHAIQNGLRPKLTRQMCVSLLYEPLVARCWVWVLAPAHHTQLQAEQAKDAIHGLHAALAAILLDVLQGTTPQPR